MANGLWCGSVNDSQTRKAINQCIVTVTDPATGDLLGLFRDRDGTKPIGNPFLTREDGKIQFFARPGRVNIEAFKDDSSQIFENEIIVDNWEEVIPPILPSGVFWRINVTQNNGDSNLAVADLHFIGPNGLQTLVPILIGAGSSEFSSSEHAGNPAWRAFDGYPVESWMTNGASTGFVGYNFGADTEVAAVSLTIRNVAPFPSRAPKNFTIESSVDGIEWTTWATITDQTGWAETEPECRIFFIDGTSRTYTNFVAAGGATISGNGQIATTNNNALDCARSDMSLTTKTYVELLNLEVWHMLGVCNENTPFDWNTGGANCAMYYINTGGNFGQLTGFVAAANLTNGFVGLAIDPAAKKLWIREIDGDWVNGDPVAGTGGHSFSGLGGSELRLCLGCGGVGSFTISARWNVGEAGFAHTPPSGFACGLYTEV